MRVVDFLIAVLEAQAQTLQRLAAFFGEELLLEILERAGDQAPAEPPFEFESEWLERPFGEVPGSAYGELEGAVREMQLSAVLQFHLWAYPPYRTFIEGPAELEWKIKSNGTEGGVKLVNHVVSRAEAWTKRLPLPPHLAAQVERAAEIPWLRFRSEVLRKIGKRPMGPVY